MTFDAGTMVLYITGLFFLYLFCRFFIKPIKWLLRLFLSTVLGGGAVWISNILLSGMGWHLALNPLTAMTVGIMGIPGMILAEILGKIL